ncbi:MAG: hypothetical protein ACOCV2_13520, partial [Persicimonas sp.]
MRLIGQRHKGGLARPLRWSVALCAGLIVMLASTAAFSATVLKLDLESLVANSDQIVEGQVVETESRVEEGKVFTYTTIEVEEGLKGSEAGETITIRQIGGRTDELATRVAGLAHFERGEKAMVFLERPGAEASPVVTGMSQGKFEIAVGPDNTTPYVVPRLGDVSLLEPVEGELEDEDLDKDGDDRGDGEALN